MTAKTRRSGYAMVFVLVFIAFMLSLYSVAHRHIASALRVEHTRSLHRQRDEGSLLAMAKGLELLETGLPPRRRYACFTTLETTHGPRSFTVKFERQPGRTWIVSTRPMRKAEILPPMPLSFSDG